MARVILIFLFLACCFNLFSLENKFSYITPEDGLSQGNIASIYQDSKGFMWFGTFNGLNRYDGYSIKVYNHDNNDSLSLAYGHVKFICEDNEHKMWLGTFGNGFSVYFPTEGVFRSINTYKTSTAEYQMRNNAGIISMKNGDMWVLDERIGLFCYDSKMHLKKAYLADSTDPKALPQVYYFAMVKDAFENIWLGADNGKLIKFSKENGKYEVINFETRKASQDDGIKTMYVDKFGIIWIGTVSQGAYSFDPNTRKFTNYRKGDSPYDLSAGNVLCFLDDWDGNLLIGTDGGGLNILDRQSGIIKKIKYELGNPESLSTNAIYSLYIDRSETLWIGTYAGGINYVGRYKNKFYTYKTNPLDPNSLSYKNVKCFLQDSEGDIWVGTDGGGINKFNEATGNFDHYLADLNNPNWLHTNVIIALYQDKDGDIYIGSYSGGLTIFNKKTNTFKQYLPDANNPAGVGGIHPWCLLQDSYGTMWVGYLSVGLDKYDKKTGIFTHYKSEATDPSTLNSPNIKVLFEDKARHLWVGTEGGGLHIFNRDRNNFTRFVNDPNDSTSLSNNDVRALYEDSKGRFWVGTGNGLDLMDREKGIFTILDTKDGLPGNIINDILEDNEGYLWISTNNGISKFSPDKNTYRNYDITDGLQGNEFNYTAAIKTRDGRLLFGGKNGFNIFRPEDIKDNTHIPAITLTDIQLANKSVNILKVKGKNITIPYLKDIILSYKDNILAFEFSALDFGNSVKNKYKYKLEGFDKDWTEVTSKKRFATYTNLSPGKYVLRIIGSNSDDIWNNDGISINLVITPPFWKRIWFIALVILIIGYLVYSYYKNKLKQRIEEKRILEEKISMGRSDLEKERKEIEKKDVILEEKIRNEEQLNWHSHGMTTISEVISKNKDDLKKLSHEIISELVKYLEVEQGAIYILRDEDRNSPYLEVMGSYAADSDRIVGRKISVDEGNIGACYKTQKVLHINNLPEGYAYCKSGLGESALTNMIAVPLHLNETVIGVVEILSFEDLPEYKVTFIEKVGETLTSILTALNAIEQSRKLIETQKTQAEEAAAQEEELRQNLEELQTTQEEYLRQTQQMENLTKSFLQKEEEYKKRIDYLEKENEVLRKET
jgi:ligand-binding sensor domain-containing protein